MNKQKPLIEFINVSKTFSIKPTGFLRNFLLGKKEKPLKVQASRNLTFEVNRGEIIGLYGPNGSGKSTLLRLAAGILVPDEGEVKIRGTIASVIELGSGLHSELTGLENIGLYGTVLGIPHSKIKKLKEKVIEFSGIGDFIHAPIKYYSAGMRARLATAIAIQADPDVLLLDEAVAVGDGDFREKFMRTIKKLKNKKAVIFTTHDFGLLYSLSDKILLLKQGNIGNAESEMAIWHAKNLPQGKTFTGLVQSNSMYPLLRRGETFKVRKNSFFDVKTDDIIAFAIPKIPQVIVHRVVQVAGLGKKRYLLTKGDASLGFDSWKVTAEDYLGKVLFSSSRSKNHH